MHWKYLSAIVALLMVFSTGQAQDNRTVISLTVPPFSEDIYEDLIEQFEAENPTIRVFLKRGQGFQEPLDPADQRFFEKARDLVSQADVLAVTSDDLSLELTRAGLLLDLNPLISGDATLNVPDFPTPVWQGFQWDGGFWALPVSVSTYLMQYDPDIFDQLGLPYPNETWTVADFENAMRNLLQVNANNQIAQAGLTLFGDADEQALLNSFLTRSLTDVNSIPLQPQLTSQPDLPDLLSAWSQLRQARLAEPNADFGNGPLTVLDTRFGFFTLQDPDAEGVALAPLPNNRAPLRISGFGISRGSQNPDAAYRLISFLSQQSETATGTFDTLSARRSQWSAGPAYPPETLALLQSAIENGQTPTQMHFSGALTDILGELGDSVPVATAIDNAQRAILTRLSQAEEQSQSNAITLVPVPEEVALQPGEVRLRFGISSFDVQLRNQAAWDRAMDDFVASEPTVGAVELEPTFDFDASALAADFDCFYTPFNLVQENNLDEFRSLDPLIATDPAVNTADFLPGVLAQVQRNNQTWALPIDINPDVITFDRTILESINLPDPDPSWTTGDFETYLRALQQANPETGKLSFFTGFFGESNSSGLLTLIANYGGLPIDFRTTPPTVQFTDPATLQATQQVLDLVRGGFIAYGNSENAFTFTTLTLESLSDAQFAFGDGSETNLGVVPVPRGSQQSALSYSVGGAYISANTPHVDACYRFISSISANPELVAGMPARSSVLNNPQVALVQGPELSQIYQSVAETMAQTNVVTFQSQTAVSVEGLFDYIWLDRAMQNYIQNGGDLNALLSNAQQLTQEFFTCKQAIDSSAGITADNSDQFFEQLQDCANRVDATAGTPNQ